ncbi:TetR/AcrR family transcriptional regulator [Saccharicrinis aurantiacus]|uniref:TetR/AcrR family transcriptional regulator n=1 Tax=Saccharicrinis aurantiacus TaxID=1849719 RepID=UPI000838F205|nr:TetR/AcrR family transcriptional regulator [Saccharicrinis aurantiacus]
MARTKKYKEDEVIEKAMNLFWRNGFEATSTRMLEKEMGINQFSIYSSFGNKEGVFLESMKCYNQKINTIVKKLENREGGIESIKGYFYDFLDFSKENNIAKGCLLANTMTELGADSDLVIKAKVHNFTANLLILFTEKLSVNTNCDTNTIAKQANYLLVSMMGLSQVSKVFDRLQIDNYIETTFENLKPMM